MHVEFLLAVFRTKFCSKKWTDVKAWPIQVYIQSRLFIFPSNEAPKDRKRNYFLFAFDSLLSFMGVKIGRSH